MEQEPRRSNFGNYLAFSLIALLVSASGAVGTELEEVADDVLAEVGRLLDNLGSDPPEQATA